MPSKTQLSTTLLILAALVTGGCDDKPEPTKTGTTSAPSAAAPPVVSAPAPSATAPAPSVPVHDCPAGSTGDATLAKPCEAKGNARMMEVTWTGKMTDTGPSFRVVNKSPSTILYGKIAVYFYDKAGKQLDVKDASGKPHPLHTCAGNLFSGVMKPAEKAVITFSCVNKGVVPEGTAQVEAEMTTVGFADATEKKSEWFWRNRDLTPDTRAKGGVK
jgi:hypothetical protein